MAAIDYDPHGKGPTVEEQNGCAKEIMQAKAQSEMSVKPLSK